MNGDLLGGFDYPAPFIPPMENDKRNPVCCPCNPLPCLAFALLPSFCLAFALLCLGLALCLGLSLGLELLLFGPLKLPPLLSPLPSLCLLPSHFPLGGWLACMAW